MKVMAIVKATADSEAGHLPDPALFEAMDRFNHELADAGVLLAGEGLKPSSAGVRVHYDGPERHVVDGPFAETKELIAGWMAIDVASEERAIELARGEVLMQQGDEPDFFVILAEGSVEIVAVAREAGHRLCAQEHQRLCRDMRVLSAWNGEKIPVTDAWEGILSTQLDSRHKPCNFVELMPRLQEHLHAAD